MSSVLRRSTRMSRKSAAATHICVKHMWAAQSPEVRWTKSSVDVVSDPSLQFFLPTLERPLFGVHPDGWSEPGGTANGEGQRRQGNGTTDKSSSKEAKANAKSDRRVTGQTTSCDNSNREHNVSCAAAKVTSNLNVRKLVTTCSPEAGPKRALSCSCVVGTGLERLEPCLPLVSLLRKMWRAWTRLPVEESTNLR